MITSPVSFHCLHVMANSDAFRKKTSSNFTPKLAPKCISLEMTVPVSFHCLHVMANSDAFRKKTSSNFTPKLAPKCISLEMTFDNATK